MTARQHEVPVQGGPPVRVQEKRRGENQEEIPRQSPCECGVVRAAAATAACLADLRLCRFCALLSAAACFIYYFFLRQKGRRFVKGTGILRV